MEIIIQPTADEAAEIGARVIARLINRPLKQLSFAASRVRDGDFDASRLDEKAVTSEIREVNIGFNRMADQLAKIEQDRAIIRRQRELIIQHVQRLVPSSHRCKLIFEVVQHPQRHFPRRCADKSALAGWRGQP